MVKWSDKWGLKFNPDKCKILHLGNRNPNFTYYMEIENELSGLESVEFEKDLGIIIDKDLSSRFAADSPKKVKVQKYPQKSSPTTHVTETSFLHVLDPPDHFGTIYIFMYIHNLDFFQQIFPK